MCASRAVTLARGAAPFVIRCARRETIERTTSSVEFIWTPLLFCFISPVFFLSFIVIIIIIIIIFIYLFLTLSLSHSLHLLIYLLTRLSAIRV